MSQKLTASKLRENIYKVLDQVLQSGVPVEIERGGRRLRIIPVDEPRASKLARLKPHPEYLRCAPDDVVHLDWSGEWRP
jgi:hypothetical protein